MSKDERQPDDARFFDQESAGYPVKMAVPGEESSRPLWKTDNSPPTTTPAPRSIESDTLPPTIDLKPPTSGDEPPGSPRLGRYRLDRRIGRGGMGAVWLGFDPQLVREVAIKVLRSDHQQRPAAVAEFLEEARCLARLNHPNILPIYDCGIDNGICYLVSEYVAGGTLAEYLRRHSLGFDESAALLARVADAAHAAHLRGIVHRDIKPGNILMREPSRPLLADFGLAISEHDQLQSTPGTLGTYAYMSPEQLRGDSQFVDGRADIYSLGVVLYEMLTGRLPYLADSGEAYRELVLKRDARPPRSVRESIPPALEAICLKCLARAPAERYTTAADLAAALRAVKQSPTWQRRLSPFWLAIAAGLSILLVAGVIGMLNQGFSAPRPNLGTDTPAPSLPQGNSGPGAQTAIVPEISASSPRITNWEVTDGGNTLRCLADKLSLFPIGELQEGKDLTFSVQLDQRTTRGQLGLFWGLSDVSGKPNWKEIQYVQLSPRSDQRLRLFVVALQYDSTAVHLARMSVLASHEFPDSQNGPHRIGFEIRQGRLARLEWDDLELSAVVEQYSAKRTTQLPGGSFGLVGQGAHGRFGKAQLNGQALRFNSALEGGIP